jgi:hypothetical protein
MPTNQRLVGISFATHTKKIRLQIFGVDLRSAISYVVRANYIAKSEAKLGLTDREGVVIIN